MSEAILSVAFVALIAFCWAGAGPLKDIFRGADYVLKSCESFGFAGVRVTYTIHYRGKPPETRVCEMVPGTFWHHPGRTYHRTSTRDMEFCNQAAEAMFKERAKGDQP